MTKHGHAGIGRELRGKKPINLCERAPKHPGTNVLVMPGSFPAHAASVARNKEAVAECLRQAVGFIKPTITELDGVDHFKVKRLGTRVPVTVPMRVDDELLDIIEESTDKKPIRVVTQVKTAQEITPISRDTFRRLSKRCTRVLNQAVLLKGVNET